MHKIVRKYCHVHFRFYLPIELVIEFSCSRELITCKCYICSRAGSVGPRARSVHLAVRRAVSVRARARLPRLHPELHLLVLCLRLGAPPDAHQEHHCSPLWSPRADRRYLDLTERDHCQVFRRAPARGRRQLDGSTQRHRVAVRALKACSLASELDSARFNALFHCVEALE